MLFVYCDWALSRTACGAKKNYTMLLFKKSATYDLDMSFMTEWGTSSTVRLLGEPSCTHECDDPYIMQFLSRQHRRTTAHLPFWSQSCQMNLSLLCLC